MIVEIVNMLHIIVTYSHKLDWLFGIDYDVSMRCFYENLKLIKIK